MSMSFNQDIGYTTRNFKVAYRWPPPHPSLKWCLIHNKGVSSAKVAMYQTSFEAWMGRRLTVSHLKIFGRIAYALVKTNTHKIDEKSEKCIFVGYCSQSQAYKLYKPISGTFVN